MEIFTGIERPINPEDIKNFMQLADSPKIAAMFDDAIETVAPKRDYRIIGIDDTPIQHMPLACSVRVGRLYTLTIVPVGSKNLNEMNKSIKIAVGLDEHGETIVDTYF